MPYATKTILRRKNKVKGLKLLKFHMNYKALVIKTHTDIGQKYRSMEQIQSRNRYRHIWSNDFDNNTKKKEQSFQ